MNKQKVVIFSHGFGSRKDDRGIFAAIADGLPDYKLFMFNYSRFDKSKNTLSVTSISEQTLHLKRVIDCATQLYQDADLYLVGHSQGCVVAAMLNPKNIKKAIFLTPVTLFNERLIMDFFSKRTGASKNRWGNSIFPRKDGTKMIVPRTYWDDMISLKPQEYYNKFCKATPTVAIYADQDEVLSVVSPDKIDSKYLDKSIILSGDHSFSGPDDRKIMVEYACKLLVED